MNGSKRITGKLHGSATLLALLVNTIATSIPILLMGLLKLLPNQSWKIFCTKIVDKLVTSWIGVNNVYLDTFHPVRWEITGVDHFEPNRWYLVTANHQSWLDIVVLQRVCTHKIPALKFFIKDELKWVPFLGFSWWAMGCPFMKRYSSAYLAAHPHKKGKDLQATKKALHLFKKTPSAIMSFVEGTRFTVQKKAQQQSPYQHLLRPKSGGISFVISAMDKKITQLIDVTIVYPHSHHSLWDFLCHRVESIKVHVRKLPIPPQFLHASLVEDEHMQVEFRTWLNQQWAEKDELFDAIKKQPTHLY
jgi:1-acyl-sn-glycerol-3-phosphate acyltransferase